MINSNKNTRILDIVIKDLECKLTDKVKTPNVINCLYLVAASMISYYGLKHKFCVYDAILRIDYVIDNHRNYNFSDALRNVFDSNNFKQLNNEVMNVCNINNDDKDSYNVTYTLFITNGNVSNISLIEGLLREINKVFLSIKKTFIYSDTDVLLRNGISNTNLTKSKVKNTCETINDVITCLQIEDLLKEIKTLDYSGNNNDLNKLLNSIKEYDMDNMILDCCLPLVNLFRPLFDLEHIKKLLNINMFEGTIENIKDEFDSVLGNGSFDRMSNKLDKLYDDFYNGYLDGNVSEYNISKDYVSIRDNFIKKYIKKKYA